MTNRRVCLIGLTSVVLIPIGVGMALPGLQSAALPTLCASAALDSEAGQGANMPAGSESGFSGAGVATSWDALPAGLRRAAQTTVDDQDAAFPPAAASLFDTEVKLTASDGAADDYFAYTVSIDGDVAIVGAPYDDDIATSSGSAYIFQRDEGGADNWGEVAKLTPSDSATARQFGYSVSISGDTAIVGARRDDAVDTYAGAAYIFRRDRGGATNWGEVTKLTASDGEAHDELGFSVSISGDTAIVGAVWSDDHGGNSGSAYIFQRDHGGASNWGEVVKLTASDAASGDNFGYSVSVDGDTAVVGARNDDDAGGNSGSGYVFQRDEGGLDYWGQVTKLTASDAASGDLFGHSVSVSNDVVIIGAYLDDDGGGGSGSAYLFQRDRGGADNWGQVTKLTASDAASGDSFGYSVSLHSDSAVVGAHQDDDPFSGSGSAYVFRRDQGGADNWGQVVKLIASDAAAFDLFGSAVSIGSTAAIVGAYSDDDLGSASGSAYILPNLAVGNDCNGNDVADDCDIDCGAPGCAPPCGTSPDCDANGVPDECDADCQPNGVPDACDISGETSPDCNLNDIPDECEVDSDEDGIIDDCDGCPNDPLKTDPGICGCADAPVDCSDGNVCTADSCVEGTGCVNDGTGITVGCDDGDACTTNDICQGDAAGTCAGTDTSAADCNDANVCTVDSCDPVTGCINDGIGITDTCDDADACTTDDQCQGDALGTCAGTPIPDCTECSLPGDCDDENLCNGSEDCQDGICVSGTPLDCNDGNLCTVDTCEPATGCINDGTGITDACDDGDACTTGDVCQADAEGTCAGTDTSETDCDDGNECTADACDSVTGCSNTPVADQTGCDDGKFCTVDDVCVSGVCEGSPRDCSDVAEPCNDAVCEDTFDTCVPEPVADGTPCPDGEFCNGTETCESGSCTDQVDPCIDLPHCDEIDDVCLECISVDECDDGLWCNGAETCDELGCQPGTGPCPEQVCDEESDRCELAVVPPDLPADATHQTAKHRYLSIDPSTNAPDDVALKVELTEMRRCSGQLSRACKVDDDCEAAVPGSGTCIQHPDVGSSWWVQAPQQEPLGCLPDNLCGDEDWFARLNSGLYFDTWALDMLHIGDCEIIPVATYEIRACAPPEGVVCSDQLIIGTIGQPYLAPSFHGNYGDVAGPVDDITEQFTPPDGFTNVVDVSAYVLTKQNYGTSNTPQTHPTWVDLHGSVGSGSPPQYILNVADLSQIKFGFLGDPWTEDPGNLQPGGCP